MPYFNQMQKQLSIKALGKLTKVFDELSKNNNDLNLIGAEKVKELSDLKNVCESIYTKLHDGKFTVAIVGLENSGKSTLGNTLIGIPDLLPTDGLRCTFTITKALAGSTANKGRVSFYTLEEFNDKFAEAVESISTLKANAVNYQNVTWAQITPNLLANANDFMLQDVKSMIEKRDKIIPLLNADSKDFSEAQLRESDFQQYITGKDPATGAFNGYPYAVKEITIWSIQFKNMSDIVLYDVPGFNSITALHKEQTDAMINEADAVILILDLLSGAQINAGHVDIFKQGCDKYGTQYKDKVFVFGNKADLLVSAANIPNPPELKLE